jgi:sirohydrochlorin cobaltochelatase
MTQLDWLQHLLAQGFHRIGQLEILPTGRAEEPYWLCHETDRDAVLAAQGEPEGFQLTSDPFQARDISTYSADHEYRFTKGQTNLRGGWLMKLKNPTDLLAAIDGFYPACFSLWVAQQRGTLDVQNLRDKLNRQTGMYRFARSISDEGAQQLVQEVCGPAHQCAKKILWKLDENTPLADSEASRFNGVSSGLPEPLAIPLLCREACNHFVAECRKASKREFEAKAQAQA